LINARPVDEFDATLEPRFRVVAEPTRSVTVHRKILVVEQHLSEHDDRFKCAGVYLAGLGERLAFERIDPGFDLRDLGLHRRRRTILCPGISSEKRRPPENSRRDNDHNELSVLASSLHRLDCKFRVRLVQPAATGGSTRNWPPIAGLCCIHLKPKMLSL
jgi:hypothetical protein